MIKASSLPAILETMLVLAESAKADAVIGDYDSRFRDRCSEKLDAIELLKELVSDAVSDQRVIIQNQILAEEEKKKRQEKANG